MPVHALAFRRYVLIIPELLCPVRSLTHVSVLPVPSETVTNVAHKS